MVSAVFCRGVVVEAGAKYVELCLLYGVVVVMLVAVCAQLDIVVGEVSDGHEFNGFGFKCIADIGDKPNQIFELILSLLR